MKLNKSKGKVHPSPSSSSSSSSSPFSLSSSSTSSTDPISALHLLLPAAILTLISALSLQDREVLAYMITRSLKSNPSTLNHQQISSKNNNKKSPSSSSKKTLGYSNNNIINNHNHKSPSFDCGCFDCYTTYWFRWDSSPHRELIHQAIEAFEEHLASTEQVKKSGKSRRREKLDKDKDKEKEKEKEKEKSVVVAAEVVEDSPEILPEVLISPEKEDFATESDVGEKATENNDEDDDVEERENQNQQQVVQQHKGLARKVLPDVIGLFNSRLWNLWGPNV